MKRRHFMTLISLAAAAPVLPLGRFAPAAPRAAISYPAYERLLRGVASYTAQTNAAISANVLSRAQPSDRVRRVVKALRDQTVRAHESCGAEDRLTEIDHG